MTGVIAVLAFTTLLFFTLWWIMCGRIKKMNESVERLQSEVEEGTSVIDSTIVFINGLANRLREALLDDADGEELAGRISELADQLDANSNRLAIAVAANTLAEDDSDVIDSNGGGAGGQDEEQLPESQPAPFTPEPDAPANESVAGEANATDGSAVSDDSQR